MSAAAKTGMNFDHMDEEATIAAALQWPIEQPWPPVAEALEPEHFAGRSQALIWSAICDLRVGGKPQDLVHACQLLRSWSEKEALLDAARILTESSGCVGNFGHWAQLVYDAGRKRVLERQVDQVRERMAGNATAEELSAAVLDAVRKVERSVDSRGLRHVKELQAEFTRELESEFRNPDGDVIATTGLMDIDDTLRLCKGGLTVVAGRPGMGKSAFAGCVAAECARDITRGAVAIFSMEMTAIAVLGRLFRRALKRSDGDLRGAISSGEATTAIAKVFGMDLYIDDRPGLGIEQIRSALMRLPRVRLVIVDYLQLAKLGEGRGERRDLALGDATKGLKALAKERECHVIVLSQLNRSVEQRNPRKPQLSDLRDSGNIEEDADNVLLLYRDEYYNPDSQERGIAEINIAKQRGGRTGTERVTWSPGRQSFENIARAQ